MAALVTSPDDVSAENIQESIEIASSHLAAGEYATALAYFEKALEAVPALGEHGAFFVNKGSALFNLDRHEDALESFSKAADLDPSLVSSMRNAANCCLVLKRREDAIEWLQRACRQSPKDLATHRKLASVMLNMDDKKEYIEMASDVIDAMAEIAPGDLSVYELRAIVHFKLERPEKFVESCWSNIWPSERPNLSESQQNVFDAVLCQAAIKLMTDGNYAAARDLYRDISMLKEDAGTPPIVGVLYNEALCVRTLGGEGALGTAMSLLRKCLEIDPSMGKAAFSLAVLLLSVDRQDENYAKSLREAAEILIKATQTEDHEGGPGPLASHREAHYNLSLACMRILMLHDASDSEIDESAKEEGSSDDHEKWTTMAKISLNAVLHLAAERPEQKTDGGSADWLVHKILGSIAINESDFEAAIHHLKLSCSCEGSPLGEDYEVQFNTGFAYLHSDQIELAFEHFQRANTIDPEREQAKRAMEMLRDSGGSTSSAHATSATPTAAKDVEQEAASVEVEDSAESPHRQMPEQLTSSGAQEAGPPPATRISTKKRSTNLSTEEVNKLKFNLKPLTSRHRRARASQEVIPWGNTASLASRWLKNASGKGNK